MPAFFLVALRHRIGYRMGWVGTAINKRQILALQFRTKADIRGSTIQDTARC
jgi:hypothetical protein